MSILSTTHFFPHRIVLCSTFDQNKIYLLQRILDPQMTCQTTERKKLRIGTDIEYLHFVMSGFGKSIKVVSPQPASINICHKMKTCNVFLLHSLWPLATAGNSDATGMSGVVEIWRKLIKRLKREHTLKYTHVQDRNDDPCLRGESLLRKFRNKLKWNLNLNLKTCKHYNSSAIKSTCLTPLQDAFECTLSYRSMHWGG